MAPGALDVLDPARELGDAGVQGLDFLAVALGLVLEAGDARLQNARKLSETFL